MSGSAYTYTVRADNVTSQTVLTASFIDVEAEVTCTVLPATYDSLIELLKDLKAV
jgi:hypothetical protein